MKKAIFAITREAEQLGKTLTKRLPETKLFCCRGRTTVALRDAWQSFDALICIMASGIVIRAIARLVRDKKTDPAVIVMDQKGNYVIPLLSGHLGGANALAEEIATITGGTAVITTASDITRNTALDIWIRDNGLRAANPGVLPRLMGKLVDDGTVAIFSDSGLPPLPHDIVQVDSPDTADILVTQSSDTKGYCQDDKLVLHPPVLVAGIGCNRGTPEEKISEAVEKTCSDKGLSPLCIFRIASIDLKADEKGLLEFSRRAKAQICLYSADELNRIGQAGYSDIVFKATGARGVCEPAAVLASGNGPLLVEKRKWKDVTTAIARAAWPWWEQGPGR